MKLRPRRIALLAVAAAVAGFGLWLWIYHLQAKGRLEAYKKELRAAGEKLTIDELTPKPVPADENGAVLFPKAMSLMNYGVLSRNPVPAMRAVAHGRAMIGWTQPDIREPKVATNSWEEALGDLAALQPALQVLAQMSDRRALQFPIDYHNLTFSYLSPLKRAANLLASAAVCDIHNGDTAPAVTNIETLLVLTKELGSERMAISQLVRLAMLQIGFSANWELLHGPALTDDHLATLQRSWENIELLEDAENSIAMERAYGVEQIAGLRAAPGKFQQYTGFLSAASPTPGNWFDGALQYSEDTWQKAKIGAKARLWSTAWSYPDELQMLRGYQVVLESMRAARATGRFDHALHDQTDKLIDLGFGHHDDEISVTMNGVADANLRSFASEGVMSLARVFNRLMVAEAARKMAITAIALERYRLRHGKYPAELAALVPEIVSAVPRDPVDGSPIRYRLESDGTYVLYSIGEDGKDDGGDPQPADPSKESLLWNWSRDWVWPRPATPGQIKAYYDNAYGAAADK